MERSSLLGKPTSTDAFDEHAPIAAPYQSPYQSSSQSSMIKRRRRVLFVTVGIFLVAALLIAIIVPVVNEKHGPAPSPNTAFFKNGAVASDVPQCSTAGAQILEEGGSVVESAIVTLLCNGIINAHSSGIGGYQGKVSAIDMRETAPAAATEDMFGGNSTLSQTGGLAVAVPGEIQGMWTAYDAIVKPKFTWAQLFSRAADIAENGFAVTAALASAVRSSQAAILADPGLRDLYAPNGTFVVQGQIIKRPALAQSLRTIGNSGNSSGFYHGQIAANLVADIQKYGGIMTQKDFANYTAATVVPLNASFSDVTLFTAPPPASGAVLVSILNIMSGFTGSIPSDPINAQRFTEACKWGFAQRTKLADPAFWNVSVPLSEMMSITEGQNIARNYVSDTMTHPTAYYQPEYDVQATPGTTHISIMLANGDAVSVTSTINTYFGSKILSPSTGIILNNEMDDFSSPNITNSFGVPPSPANFIRPGKRPLSSSVPTLAVDAMGITRVAIGASGGTKITTSTAQILIDILTEEFGYLDLAAAIARPRLHQQLLPNNTYYETGVQQEIINYLQTCGQRPTLWSDYAAVQAIIRNSNNLLEAVCDPRKGGIPSGF